ncbi:uracil permease, partial [Aureobasidium melanogenum]
LQVRNLYSADKTGPYYFTFGVHWRAYASYIAGILINVVGFAGAVGQKVPKGATYIYDLNYFCGFFVAAATYWCLCKVSPIPATSETWLEVDDDGEPNSLAYDGQYDEEAMGDMMEDGKKPDAKVVQY